MGHGFTFLSNHQLRMLRTCRARALSHAKSSLEAAAPWVSEPQGFLVLENLTVAEFRGFVAVGFVFCFFVFLRWDPL